MDPDRIGVFGADLLASPPPGFPWRLRPHFVFNALNSIGLMARQGERQRALRLVTVLGDLLQRSLATPDGDVTLADEAAFVPRYVEVEQVRYDISLAIRYELEDEALDALVPVFVLQPLVEDLIRHTLAAPPGQRHLQVRGRVLHRCLEIELRSPDAREARRVDSRGSAYPGTRQLRAMLEERYGTAYRLAVVSDSSGVSVARLRIPHLASRSTATDTDSAAGFGC